jgi:hypothetical protein
MNSTEGRRWAAWGYSPINSKISVGISVDTGNPNSRASPMVIG